LLITPDDLSPWLQNRSFDQWRQNFDQDGYLIFNNVLTAAQVNALRSALEPFIAKDVTGRNDFEGLKSNRVYALLAKSPLFAELAIHPLALAFAEADLGASCLLSACLAINLQPGETVQPWHHDDAHLEIPRPRPSWGVSAFWAIDDMTETNGATEILPGSHHWNENFINGSTQASDFSKTDIGDPEYDPGARTDTHKVVMSSGSLMLAKGTLWHRGGTNQSNNPRLIITPQYCPGWARQLENMQLAVPENIVSSLPKRARELIGYSIHPPFMGYVDGVHPKRLLKK